MNAYIAQIRMNIRLTLRNRMALVFGYLFPLAYFVIMGKFTNPSGAAAAQMVNMVLTLGVIGGGLFGAGIRAAMDREQNVLRRFKVAPINAGPILVGQMATSLFNYLPLAALVIFMAHQMYGMPWPSQPLSLFAFIVVGMLAFASIGGIVAAVVNSMQESAMFTQLLYFPMLFLSGATFPIAIMPAWLQTVTQFIPATHFSSGMTGILRGTDTIVDRRGELAALALTAVVATFLAAKLFRWEKEEKLRASAKLWVLAVLAPFLLMGAWQTHTKTNLAKAKTLMRDLRRSNSFLIRDVRVFVGDGTVIERGSVLVKDGKIAEVYTGTAPDPETLKADPLDAAGKTLLPGLIDVSVHLDRSGSAAPDTTPESDQNIDRALAAYLYSGVTAVNSTGDAVERIMKHGAAIASGEKLGAELFVPSEPNQSALRDGFAGAAGPLTEASFAQMKQMGITFDPANAAIEASIDLRAGKQDPFDRVLVQQVVPRGILDQARAKLSAGVHESTLLSAAQLNLATARRLGVSVLPGTDSGSPLLFHGPALHRELQLWVQAGIAPAAALQAATYDAARFLHADRRIGVVRKDYEATLLLVDGNPLQEISATERISSVFFKGERINRQQLFDQK